MGENSFIALLVLFNLIFIIFIGGIIIFIREYRVKKRSHKEQVENITAIHKKALLETQLEIQELTMKHIGREIHDNIGQKLTLASIYLQQLDYENKASNINESITTINSVLNQSLKELRQLSKSLTDDTISELSISELLFRECNKIRDLKIYKVLFEHKINSDVSYPIKSVLLRITQEFFQNSIKHSNCTEVSILLSENGKNINLLLKDNGKGFNMDNINKDGIGLRNMEKRTQILNGNFDLKSNIQLGTVLNVQIPL